MPDRSAELRSENVEKRQGCFCVKSVIPDFPIVKRDPVVGPKPEAKGGPGMSVDFRHTGRLFRSVWKKVLRMPLHSSCRMPSVTSHR
jgi:hypothetical protein